MQIFVLQQFTDFIQNLRLYNNHLLFTEPKHHGVQAVSVYTESTVSIFATVGFMR